MIHEAVQRRRDAGLESETNGRPAQRFELRRASFHQVALLILGVGAQIEATRLEEARAGIELWGLFQEALSKHPGELPVLSGHGRHGIPALDTAFDELVWFTLTGIARRRGEVLPTQPPSSLS